MQRNCYGEKRGGGGRRELGRVRAGRIGRGGGEGRGGDRDRVQNLDPADARMGPACSDAGLPPAPDASPMVVLPPPSGAGGGGQHRKHPGLGPRRRRQRVPTGWLWH